MCKNTIDALLVIIGTWPAVYCQVCPSDYIAVIHTPLRCDIHGHSLNYLIEKLRHRNNVNSDTSSSPKADVYAYLSQSTAHKSSEWLKQSIHPASGLPEYICRLFWIQRTCTRISTLPSTAASLNVMASGYGKSIPAVVTFHHNYKQCQSAMALQAPATGAGPAMPPSGHGPVGIAASNFLDLYRRAIKKENMAPSAECRQGPAGLGSCLFMHPVAFPAGNSGCSLPCTSKFGIVLHPGDARRDVRNHGLYVIAVWVCSCAVQSESPGPAGAAAYACACRARV